MNPLILCSLFVFSMDGGLFATQYEVFDNWTGANKGKVGSCFMRNEQVSGQNSVR
jgi:hypothetical protein